jgi:serine/threonine protein kinase
VLMSDSLWHIPDEHGGSVGDDNVFRFYHDLISRGVALDPLVLDGRYAIHHVLGQGGTGLVLQATDGLRQQKIALKVMNPELVGVLSGAESFQKEARLAVRLKHDHILRVYDVLEIQGLKMLSMELLLGVNLREYVARMGSEHFRDPLAVFEIISPLLQALIYAHRHTIHRDIKPENVGIESSGHVKLMDFGIARIRDLETTRLARSSMTQIHAGTPFYAAPEQLYDPATVGPSVDQYALGVMAYELLTGTLPIGVASPLEILRPELPVRLTRAFDRALSRKPEDRYPDMEAFAAQVEQGMKIQRFPLRRAMASRQGKRWWMTVSIMCLLVLSMVVIASLIRQQMEQKSSRLDAIWKKLKYLESTLTQSEQLWQEHYALANMASNDFQNALTRAKLGLIRPSDWIQMSNRNQSAFLVLDHLERNGVHRANMQDDWEKLRHLRRLVMTGDLEKSEKSMGHVSDLLEKNRHLLKEVTGTVAMETKAQALVEAAKWLHMQGWLSDVEWNYFDHLEGATFSGNVTHTLENDLAPKVIECLERMELRYVKARERWMSLSKGLEPEALGFIVNVSELVRQARLMRSNDDLAGAARQFLRSYETLEQWGDELQETLDRSEPSWSRLSDKIENAVGMRFVRIGTGYLSIWETRVMDFARFVHEQGAGFQSVGEDWMKPGYPVTPGSPVVNISLNAALTFSAWLQSKFPYHQTDAGILGGIRPEAQDPLGIFLRERSVHMAMLVDPDAFESPWFKNNYQDLEVKSGEWIQSVGRSKPDDNGIFDLHGNAWEWTTDIYEDYENPPVSHHRYPLLVGGAAGSVTFHNYEPLSTDLKCVVRPEMIGFRVYTSALHRKDDIQ